jgi:hypothetical protein
MVKLLSIHLQGRRQTYDNIAARTYRFPPKTKPARASGVDA